MKRYGIVITAVVCVSAVLVWRPWWSRFGHHVHFPLPPTATLINYHHSWGRDFGDEFEFTFTDNALRDAIIKEWDLKPSVRDGDVMSFAQVKGAPWWPSAKLKGFPERYGRVDSQAANYWSLWVDRANGKLYAEYGNW